MIEISSCEVTQVTQARLTKILFTETEHRPSQFVSSANLNPCFQTFKLLILSILNSRDGISADFPVVAFWMKTATLRFTDKL